MSMPLKILFSLVVGLAAVAVILAVVILVGLGTDPGRARLEAVLANVLSMSVRIGGPVQVGYSRGLIVTLGDLQIRNRERNVTTAEAAEIGVEVVPLLYGQLRLRSIRLRSPIITIERAADGTLSVDRPDAKGGAARAISVGRVAITEGLVRYEDARSGAIFEGGNCDLDLRDVEFGAAAEQDLWKHLAFVGHLDCSQVGSGAFSASGLELAVQASAGVWVADVLTMNLFGGQGSGTLHVDLTHTLPRHAVRYTLSRFHVEEFFRALSPDEVVAGKMTFTASLSARGRTFGEARQSLEGTFGLRGESLTLHGTDIDRTFSDYESSQRFNLVDLGAFFFAGPLGLVVTKGFDFASISQGTGGSSEISLLVSDWNVAHGVAEAQDVAMATNENRVALQGRLDLVDEQFVGLRVALIDSDGCAVAEQKIRGTFQKPVIEQPNVLKTLIGPARELLSQGRDLVAGDDDCETFYAGTVAPPD